MCVMLAAVGTVCLGLTGRVMSLNGREPCILLPPRPPSSGLSRQPPASAQAGPMLRGSLCFNHETLFQREFLG